MGGTSYSVSNRSSRTQLYASQSVSDTFVQQKVGRAHETMSPKEGKITFREARDSEVHPESFPIIIAMDETGSMGEIPVFLVKEALPQMVNGLITGGVASPSILFMGVGDHFSDSDPLQIGQFESGDEELDLWLTRTYLEGNGGGNGGESYALAHYFAARHTATDHWDKRKKKGVLITIGDEAMHKEYSSEAMKGVMGVGDIASFTSAEIIAEAKEKWEIFHIIPGNESHNNRMSEWKELLGENNVIKLESKAGIVEAIRKIVFKVAGTETVSPKNETKPDKKEEIL